MTSSTTTTDGTTPRPEGGAREALLAAAGDELAEHGYAGVSLRAVARRAGLSHAAPQHFFGSRAGLLTAVAAAGFQDLTAALTAVATPDPRIRLADLGRIYIDFGLSRPALFDLMFRPSEIHPDDPVLVATKAAAIQALAATANELPTPSAVPPDVLTALSWALVHGLVVLVRDGALRDPRHPDDPDAAGAYAHTIATTLGLLSAGKDAQVSDDRLHTEEDRVMTEMPRVGAPAARALKSAGYRTHESLAGAATADLLALHGVGPRAVRIIGAALTDAKLPLLR